VPYFAARVTALIAGSVGCIGSESAARRALLHEPVAFAASRCPHCSGRARLLLAFAMGCDDLIARSHVARLLKHDLTEHFNLLHMKTYRDRMTNCRCTGAYRLGIRNPRGYSVD
jgi:hypothetical protein